MLLILIILLVLLVPLGGGWYTNYRGNGYYTGGGIGLGTVLVILLVLFLLGLFR